MGRTHQSALTRYRAAGPFATVRSLGRRLVVAAFRMIHRLLGVPELRHIPGPRGLEFLRLMLHFQRDSLGALELTRARYGPIVAYPWPINTVIVYEPSAVSRVLVENQRNYGKGAQTDEMKVIMGNGLVTNSDRASWAKSRAIVNRAMSAGAVRGFLPVFARSAERMMARWNATLDAEGCGGVDAWRDMRTVTFEIAGTTLLGADLSDDDARSVDDAVRFTSRVIHDHMFQLLPVPYWVPTRVNRQFHQHRRNLDRIVSRLIRTAKESPAADDCVLARLVQGRDPETDEQLGETTLRDEILTLLIAGYETTASTLAWVLASIASDLSLQSRLQAEIDESGTEIDWATFRRTHPLTHSTILEAMRLYTAIAMSSRRAEKDDVLSGFRVPAGTSVVIPVWVLHRDPEHWHEPLEFDPERFSGCPMSHSSAYVPFSKGERGCVGRTFAIMEVAVIITRILSAFSLSLPGGMPRAVSHVSLTPQGGLSLGIVRRRHA